jgi:hypothetical protein
MKAFWEGFFSVFESMGRIFDPLFSSPRRHSKAVEAMLNKSREPASWYNLPGWYDLDPWYKQRDRKDTDV